LSSLPILSVLNRAGPPVDEQARLSLVDVLASVPDPRAARGVRHGVLSVLLISACAVLAGARSYAAIAEYARDVGREVLDLLQVGAVAPDESTIRRVLQRLDPDALDAALRAWTLARSAAQQAHAMPDQRRPRPQREQRRVLAVDGKTVRGARRPDGSPSHLVAVFDQANATVLAQREIADKGGEVAVFAPLLDTLNLTDVLVTADALHTQRAHAHYLHTRGAHYLMTVKANQCATRRSGTSPPVGGTDSKGGLLGLMADLEPKGEGDQSMPGNRWPGSGAWDGAPGDPRGMTKTGLCEPQSPAAAIYCDRNGT